MALVVRVTVNFIDGDEEPFVKTHANMIFEGDFVVVAWEEEFSQIHWNSARTSFYTEKKSLVTSVSFPAHRVFTVIQDYVDTNAPPEDSDA